MCYGVDIEIDIEIMNALLVLNDVMVLLANLCGCADGGRL